MRKSLADIGRKAFLIHIPLFQYTANAPILQGAMQNYPQIVGEFLGLQHDLVALGHDKGSVACHSRDALTHGLSDVFIIKARTAHDNGDFRPGYWRFQTSESHLNRYPFGRAQTAKQQPGNGSNKQERVPKGYPSAANW